jgi:hypothetical protein
MPPTVHRVTPANMGEILHATPFALLRLDAGRAEFERGVTSFFGSAYPDQFTFGQLCRGDIRQAGWLEQVFKSSVGVLRSGVNDGYYLFHRGLVAGMHRGVISSVTYGGTDREAQLERIVKHGFHGIRVNEATLEAARQICMYFDEIAARRQVAAGERDNRYVHETPPGASTASRTAPPPPARPAPSAGDAFSVLGVDPSASDAEVKAAYKQQVKLNHPDKVAHLSPALQEFAKAQTLAINQAFATIMSVRDK